MEPPIDRGWAWISLIGVWLSCFFMVGSLKSIGILFVEFIEMFNASSSLTAWTMGIILSVMSITSPIACALGERYSYRKVVMTGGFLMFLALILATVVPNLISLICIFAPVTGIGYGLTFTPSMVVVTIYFKDKRAMATGIAVTGSSVGQFVIPQMIRALIDHYSLRGALLVFAALNLHVVVAGALFRPFSFYGKQIENEPNKDEEDANVKFSNGIESHTVEVVVTSSSDHVDAIKEGSNEISADIKDKNLEDDKSPKEMSPFVKPSDQNKNKNKQDTDRITTRQKLYRRLCCISSKHNKPLLDFSLFKLWVFRSYFIGVCLSYFGYINPILFLPAYARDQGVDPFNAALLISIMAVADFFGRLISGFIGNMGWIRRSIILACSQAVAGAVLIVATLFPSYTSALVICLSHGAIGGALFSLFSVVLVDFIGPTKISAGVGLAYLGMGFTQTPMPSLLGYLRDITGTYKLSYFICGSVGILSSLFYLIEPLAARLDKKKEAQANPPET